MRAIGRSVPGSARRALIAVVLAVGLCGVVAAVAGAATPGALTQYDDGGQYWVTTGPVTSGFAPAVTLGFLSPAAVPGARALYGCTQNADRFLSLDPGCEGQSMLRTEGYIYTTAPAGVASAPVYRCSVPGSDHFASSDPRCGGEHTDGLLGYAPVSAALNRYNGGLHWVTTGSPPSGYRLEGTLGYLVASGAGTAPLYGCAQGSDQFLSLDPGCEGQTPLGLEGRIYVSPPAAVASNPLYRCQTSADHFASTDPNCEGQRTEGRLGYVLQAPVPPPRPTPKTPSAPTTIPQPLGSARHARLLHVTLIFRWRWVGPHTRLTGASISRLPGSARVRITCRGRDRGCATRTFTARRRGIRRLIRAVTGHVYRAGDRIYITVTAHGYQPERAEIRIRNGKLPTVGLL